MKAKEGQEVQVSEVSAKSLQRRQVSASGCKWLGKRADESASDGRNINVSCWKGVAVSGNDRPGAQTHTSECKEMQVKIAGSRRKRVEGNAREYE